MTNKPKLETGASAIVNQDWPPSQNQILISIALSLKRIADATERDRQKDKDQ